MKTLPTFPTKKTRLAFFRDALRTSPSWALRALEVIYSFQTADEQTTGQTIKSNGVGFSGCDAEFLSSLAEQARKFVEAKEAGTNKFPSPLSPNQKKWLLKKISKYAGQLILVLEGKATPGIEIVKVSKAKGKKGKPLAA